MVVALHEPIFVDDRARMVRPVLFEALAQFVAQDLEMLVGEQLLAQRLFGGGGLFGQLVDERWRRRRQQAFRLDEDEGRGDDQVFAGKLDVQRFHERDIGQVLLADGRERDLGDVQVLRQHELQQ